jgi:hypothetical protein
MPVGAVEIGDVAGLAKPVDAERDDRVAGDGAEPRQRRRVEVADGDEGGTRPQPRQHPFGDTALAANACRLPVAVQAVGRGDRQEAGSRDVFGYRDNPFSRLAVDPGRIEN